NASQGTPLFDVTGALQVCPSDAALLGRAGDEPGPRFTAGTFAALAPNNLQISVTGSQPTTSTAAPTVHAKNADPVGNLATTARRQEAGPGQEGPREAQGAPGSLRQGQGAHEDPGEQEGTPAHPLPGHGREDAGLPRHGEAVAAGQEGACDRLGQGHDPRRA